MSEPFPSKAYIAFCTQPEVAEMLRKECGEFMFGDLVIDCDRVAVVTGVEEDDVMVDYRDYGAAWCNKRDLIPLPQPRQLIEMLKERSYKPLMISTDNGWAVFLFGWLHRARGNREAVTGKFEGPDPASALLKAWLEVVENEI